jgi:pyruvate/2-oxoglutarate dehydrogenase complex dihydrolipoamide acyltransferase (E2) component
MAGGTFTISNVRFLSLCFRNNTANLKTQGGVFGSLMGTPIINVPQTG